MPLSYGPAVPVDDMPADLMMAAQESDDAIGGELSAIMPEFDRPINIKVMDALTKAMATVAKVMNMDIVPEKYTEPVTRLDDDVVRFLAMMESASADYGKKFPVSLPEAKDEQALTAITAHLISLSKDKDFEAFLDMPEGDGPEVQVNIDTELPDGEMIDEEFDFSSRMR